MDEELFENLPEPGEQDVDKINPWHRPILLIVWGIFLTTVTFNFLYLDKLLPPVGILLMYLGFRPLRGENGGFKAAYWISAARLALEVVALPLSVTPVYSADAAYMAAIPAGLLQVGQLIALRAGLAEVFDRTGTPRRLGGVNWLIVFTSLMAVGALAQWGDLGVLGFVVIGAYIAVIVAVARFPRALGDTGCVLRNSPVRLSDDAMAAVTVGTLAVLTVGAWFGGLALSVPEARPFGPRDILSTPENLPAEIWEVLYDEDAALFEGAENIQYDRTAENESGDVEGIHLYTVTAELPDAKLLILQYFRWDEGGPWFGDGLAITQSSNILTRAGPIRGRVVYERGGESFSSPIRDLRGGIRTFRSFFGQSSDDIITGDIFVPLSARHTRGYVLYTVEAESETRLHYNCQIRYYHRDAVDSAVNPKSPSESLLEGRYSSKKQVIFYTLFTAWGPEELPDTGDLGYTVYENALL